MRRALYPILFFFFFSVAAFTTLPHYGLTWDFHVHFFSGAHFLGYDIADVEPRALPYGIPDPRGTIYLPYGPFVQIVPFASFMLFSRIYPIVPDDVAYHLPIVATGIAGMIALYFLLKLAINKRTAFLSIIFLGLTPRFFSDIHNNMKDTPSAAVFAFNMFLLWRLVTYRRFLDFLLAAIGFAIAFNTKVNAIYIPIVFGFYLLCIGIKKPIQYIKKNPYTFLYYLAAPLLAFLLWWLFWGDPIGQIKLMFLTFGRGTDNIEVLLNGTWYCSGRNVPWYYALYYVGITTQLPILIFFTAGVMFSIIRFWKTKRSIYILLVLWFFVPLTRYLSPRTGVIDGIRHFEEILYPLSGLAAVACDAFLTMIEHTAKSSWIKKYSSMGIIGFLTVILLIPMVRYHPYQITYYNELVGGIEGALGKFDLDYWGGSQKAAVQWLNIFGEKNSTVSIVMAPDVAARYLRPDLLANVNTLDYTKSDYTVILNRTSFFYRYYMIYDYILTHTPIHTIKIMGVPLVFIYDNRNPPTPRQKQWWSGTGDPCMTMK